LCCASALRQLVSVPAQFDQLARQLVDDFGRGGARDAKAALVAHYRGGRSDVEADGRSAGCHGFHDYVAELLVKAWVHEDISILQVPEYVLSRQVPGKPYGPADAQFSDLSLKVRALAAVTYDDIFAVGEIAEDTLESGNPQGDPFPGQ
jgi:hypothetical protein